MSDKDFYCHFMEKRSCHDIEYLIQKYNVSQKNKKNFYFKLKKNSNT